MLCVHSMQTLWFAASSLFCFTSICVKMWLGSYYIPDTVHINIHLLGAIKLYAFYTSNTVQLLRSRNVERDSNFPSRFKCGVLISRDIEFSKCRALRTQVSSLSLQKTQAFTWSLLTLLTAQWLRSKFTRTDSAIPTWVRSILIAFLDDYVCAY